MFEDALFATNHRRSPQQRWAASLSFILQASFVTVLVALPLFFTEALPLNTTVINELPRPYRTPPLHPLTRGPGYGRNKQLVSSLAGIWCLSACPLANPYLSPMSHPPPRRALESAWKARLEHPTAITRSITFSAYRVKGR